MGPAPLRRRWSRRFIGFDAETLYAVAADIERYREFAPGCISARIVEKTADHWVVENVFGFGSTALSRFVSVARPAPPSGLSIRSQDGPWRDFAMDWTFQPAAESCLVVCEAILDFRSPLLALLARLSAGEVERQVAAAFENRARALNKERRI